jgi:hypothetical protein
MAHRTSSPRLVCAPGTRLGSHPTRDPPIRPWMGGPPRLVRVPRTQLGSRPTRAPFIRPRMDGPPRLVTAPRLCAPHLTRLSPDARPVHPSAHGRSTAHCHRAPVSTRDLPIRPRMGSPPRVVRAPRTCASHPARLSPDARPVYPPADERPTAPCLCAPSVRPAPGSTLTRRATRPSVRG